MRHLRGNYGCFPDATNVVRTFSEPVLPLLQNLVAGNPLFCSGLQFMLRPAAPHTGTPQGLLAGRQKRVKGSAANGLCLARTPVRLAEVTAVSVSQQRSCGGMRVASCPICTKAPGVAINMMACVQAVPALTDTAASGAHQSRARAR